MPKRLRIKRLDRVGFVDKGDDPEATIVFWKRAETFAEQKDESRLHDEIWETTSAMSSALRSALFDADEDQDPEAIILTSLDQFVATVKAKLPMWLQGKPVDKAKKKGTTVPASEKQPPTGIVGWLKKVATDLKWPQEEIEEIEKLGQEEGSEGDSAKEGDMEGFDVTTLPDEAQAEFQKREEEIAELKEQVAKAKADGEPDPEEEPVSDEVQKRLDASEERAEKAEKRIQKMEDAATNASFVEKASAYKHLPGWTADDQGPVLAKIAVALESGEFEKLQGVLKGADEAIRTGDLLRVVGGSEEPDEDSAEAELKAEVEKAMAADAELDEQVARGQVFRKNADLQRRVEDERRARISGI